MQHVPEGVIQAPESPDAPEALPGCRSISDDDLCAWCTRLLYRPGEISLCRLSIQAMASGHPSVTGTVTRTAVRNFSRISFIPDITGSHACADSAITLKTTHLFVHLFTLQGFHT